MLTLCLYISKFCSFNCFLYLFILLSLFFHKAIALQRSNWSLICSLAWNMVDVYIHFGWTNEQVIGMMDSIPRIRVHVPVKTVPVQHLFPIQRVGISGPRSVSFSPPAPNPTSSSQEALREVAEGTKYSWNSYSWVNYAWGKFPRKAKGLTAPSLTLIGINLDRFRIGPLINKHSYSSHHWIAKGHNQYCFPGEKWLKSRDYTLTDRICPWERERKKKAETFLSNWIFYIPKALLFLTGFNTKYLHKWKRLISRGASTHSLWWGNIKKPLGAR